MKTLATAQKNNSTASETMNSTEPLTVRGVLQFVIPTRDESMHMIHKSLLGLQQTIEQSHQETTSLLRIVSTTLYEGRSHSSRIEESEMITILEDLHSKMDALAGVFASLPEWIPAHTLQDSTGLSVDAIRKQLLNPRNFEPEVDCKQIGKIWHINKNAIPKVRRQK